jgi:hypothetical protein
VKKLICSLSLLVLLASCGRHESTTTEQEEPDAGAHVTAQCPPGSHFVLKDDDASGIKILDCEPDKKIVSEK